MRPPRLEHVARGIGGGRAVGKGQLQRLGEEPFCYVTTTGRRTGRPHEIEIWFALHDSTLYLLSGGMDRSDWIRNMRADPVVRVRLGDVELAGTAREVVDPREDERARRLLATKYQGWREGGDMSHWARTALTVAIDVG